MHCGATPWLVSSAAFDHASSDSISSPSSYPEFCRAAALLAVGSMFRTRNLKKSGAQLLSTQSRWFVNHVGRSHIVNKNMIKSMPAAERIAEFELFNPTMTSTERVRCEPQIIVDKFFISKAVSKYHSNTLAELLSRSASLARENGKITLIDGKHLPDIASRLTALSTSEWSYDDISTVFLSLRHFNSTNKGFAEALSAMLTIVSDERNRGKIASPGVIASMITSLQKSEYDDTTVEKTLSLATLMINDTSGHFSGTHICDILYGLQEI